MLHWGQIYGLPVNSIRIFNAYGTRSRTTGAYGAVFGVFLAQKLAGKPLTIVGDGTQTRDFLYVTDVARAFYAAATTHQGSAYLQSRRRQPAIGESSGRSAGRLSRPHAEASRRAGLHLGRYHQNSPGTRLVAPGFFRDWRDKMLENIDYWREAPVWDPASIADATKNWFAFLEAKQAGSAS